MNNISWISFYKLIMSQNSYKETYKELIERLQCATCKRGNHANYFQGVQVSFDYRANLSYTGVDYWDEENTYTFNMYGRTHISVVGHRKEGKPERESSSIKNITKKIFKSLLKTLYSKFLEEIQYYDSNITVTQISVGKDNYDRIEFHIEDGLTAWDWDYVYLWHTEQECGEGWLCASRDPKVLEEQTTITVW